MAKLDIDGSTMLLVVSSKCIKL